MNAKFWKKKKLADECRKKMIGKITKSQLAKQLGISRSSRYYQHKLPKKDWALKQQIEETLREYPSYGHKRIALGIKVNLTGQN